MNQPGGPLDVFDTFGDLLKYLRDRGKAWEDALKDDQLTITVNRQFVNLDQPHGEHDEIALVSKGLGRAWACRVQRSICTATTSPTGLTSSSSTPATAPPSAARAR